MTRRGSRDVAELPPVVRWRKAFTSDAGPPSPMTRAVLLYLSTEMRADGTRCFPSYGTIAKALKMHERTVATHVKKAEAGGWLAVTQRAGGSGGRFNMYFPSIPAAVMAERPQDEPHGESTDDQPVGRAPIPSSEAAQRVDPESERVGGGLQPVGSEPQRVRGGPTDLVAVPGSNQAVDLIARAREEARQWLGDHADAVDLFLETMTGGARAFRGLWATYRPGGTAELLINEWANLPSDQRPTVFAMSLDAYASDFTDWKSHLFRAVLKDKIRESRLSPGDEDRTIVRRGRFDPDALDRDMDAAMIRQTGGLPK